MIKTIVFDIGNVLTSFRWEEYLKDCGYDEETIRRVGNATVRSGIWQEWDRCAREEEDFIRDFLKRDPGVEKEILDFFEHYKDWVWEYDYAADLIQRLKANGYQVYLLSNYSKNGFLYLSESFKFHQYVDGEIISYQVKHIKPEPEIYEDLIRKYDIIPEEAVFLDDMQANLEGAKPFGFHTIRFTGLEKALEELRTLGVRI
jgi:putative hydrolase of the HAD superfamily